jgi:hypothetical protein
MVVGDRSTDGVSIDGSVQYLSEAPHWQGDGETVDVVDDSECGEETVENVPVPDGGDCERERDGQTTLDDWGWSQC